MADRIAHTIITSNLSSYKIALIVILQWNLPTSNFFKIFNLPTNKKSSMYQLFYISQTTNFQISKIWNLPTFQISQTYQLKNSKTCKLLTFLSKSRGGPSPLDLQLSQPCFVMLCMVESSLIEKKNLLANPRISAES